MAGDTVVQLFALCAASSFFYISQTLERHSLTESPRLSSFLVFLLSGLTDASRHIVVKALYLMVHMMLERGRTHIFLEGQEDFPFRSLYYALY
ncbi:hypothetical protein Forpi1262_v001526 [Fusarium oxysporum f. sp. raphani]|uniref:Uncharacterized protein n=1 Tax=Fusarium oxysporum f. sp. raphani TaxID=96318 RepID=A0A8J5PXT0_FUSOX|nr:hypothetical protein Forpi1262_v001526 [Fusarium oxysporum f. sp. raphani]